MFVLALLALPTAFLVLLRAVPGFDLQWFSPDSHLVVVSAIANVGHRNNALQRWEPGTCERRVMGSEGFWAGRRAANPPRRTAGAGFARSIGSRSVTTYVALLRAVNVGSTNRIKMADLKAGLVAGGLVDAVTHIQSGNVVFTSKAGAKAVKAQVEKLIDTSLGLTVTTIIRTAAELDAITAANPFVDADTRDISKLYVAFLDAKPTNAAVEAFLAAPIGGDEVHVDGKEVYIRYDVGAGTTKLTAGVWKKLGVPARARTWNVTTTLARLAADHH